MSATDATTPLPRTGLRIVLLMLGIIEFLKSLSGVAVLLDDDPTIPGTTPGGLVISATIVLIPIFALAAVSFAARARLLYAIFAMAGVALLAWLSLLPSMLLHWADFPGTGMIGAIVAAQFLLFPVLAGASIVLARRDHLGLATLCVALPTIVDILGAVAFAVGVALYGF